MYFATSAMLVGCTCGLRRGPYRPLDEPFDSRVTPREWLEFSAGQPPEVTLEELRLLSAEEADALLERMEPPDQEVVPGPYGPIPWTVLSAHVLWDAWLHERDVALFARGGLPSTPVEDAVVALYALFIASMPAALHNYDFEVSVALVGNGCHYSASVVPGRVELVTLPYPSMRISAESSVLLSTRSLVVALFWPRSSTAMPQGGNL